MVWMWHHEDELRTDLDSKDIQKAHIYNNGEIQQDRIRKPEVDQFNMILYDWKKDFTNCENCLRACASSAMLDFIRFSGKGSTGPKGWRKGFSGSWK